MTGITNHEVPLDTNLPESPNSRHTEEDPNDDHRFPGPRV
jgi:hypothetical protein